MRAAMVALSAVLICACDTAPTSTATSPTPSAAHAVLVFTTWTKDAKVTNGPEPGYRPALTALTSDDVTTATPIIDASGSTWLIAISFTPAGELLFAKLTSDNVAACPGDVSTPSANCPERHLAMWLDLTQADIDHWDDPSYVAKVGAPFDLACLTAGAGGATAPCAKFLSDPITAQPITGGQAQIAGNFTQQTATDVAAAITSH